MVRALFLIHKHHLDQTLVMKDSCPSVMRSQPWQKEAKHKESLLVYFPHKPLVGLPWVSVGKESACNVGDLGQEDPLEKEMATHSSNLVWKIPWTEDAAMLQSLGLQRVRHNWVTNTAKNPPAMQNTCVRSLGLEDPLKKGMAAQSSIPAWVFLWTGKPRQVQSMGNQRVRQDWVTGTFIFQLNITY